MITVDLGHRGQWLVLALITLIALTACGGTTLKDAPWERHEFELDDMTISMELPLAPPGKRDYYYLGSRTVEPLVQMRKLYNDKGMEIATRAFDWSNARELSLEVSVIVDQLTPTGLRSGDENHAVTWLRRVVERDSARCAANPRTMCDLVVQTPHLVTVGDTPWALLVERSMSYEERWYMRALSNNLVLRTKIDVKYDWLSRRGNAQLLDQAIRRHLESIKVVPKAPIVQQN